MSSLQKILEKLNELRTANIVNEEEFITHRRRLISLYVTDPEDNTWDYIVNLSSSSGSSSTSYGPSFSPRPEHAQNFGGYNTAFCEAARPCSATATSNTRHPPLSVEMKDKNNDGKDNPHAERCTIKVQPLPFGLSRDWLHSSMSVYGEVESVVIPKNSSPFGYVNFQNSESALSAARQRALLINGTYVKVTLCNRAKAATAEPTNGLGLFNLPPSTTHDELYHMLSEYPGLLSIKMIHQKGRHFKGYAFVYFDSIDNASYAKERLSGLTLQDQRVDVKFAAQSADHALKELSPV